MEHLSLNWILVLNGSDIHKYLNSAIYYHRLKIMILGALTYSSYFRTSLCFNWRK